jgi:hypothetical protein
MITRFSTVSYSTFDDNQDHRSFKPWCQQLDQSLNVASRTQKHKKGGCQLPGRKG